MDNQRTIMILGASVLQIPAIIKAKEMGLNVIAVDMDSGAPGFKYADNSLTLSTIDSTNILKAALSFKPDAIMTLASDMPIRTVAIVGEKLGLSTISLETAINATNKGKMRKKLKSMNVPVPDFFIVNNVEEYHKAVEKIKGKFIVKPCDSSGSRGIILVENTNHLDKAYWYAKEHSKSGEVIVEEYMEGPEVSVETMTMEGKTHVIAITDKITSGAPHFVEMGHSIPSKLSENIQGAIEKIAVDAVEAIGINIGPSHTEIIVTQQGPKIVELGARLGGDNITTHLVPLSTGIDMVELSIRVALGENVEIIEKKTLGSAIRYLTGGVGSLSSISYPNNLFDIEGLMELVITKNVGDYITDVGSSKDRIGYVISQSNNVVNAINICNKALQMFEIKYK